MRIVIDIDDKLVARWGSLFIHPLSYEADKVRLFVPGFECEKGKLQETFKVLVLNSPPAKPPQPAQSQQPVVQEPESPSDYQPAQIPPEATVPPVVQKDEQKQSDVQKPSSQQPTPSDAPPLSIVESDKETGGQDGKGDDQQKGDLRDDEDKPEIET